MKKISFVVQLVYSMLLWAGGECNNHPSTGAAKAIAGRDKSHKTAAGKCWR